MAWVELEAARNSLAPEEGRPGLFERTLGFRTATQKFHGVHLMNDVCQCVLGGAPQHGGDFLARIIRYDKEAEANSEEDLRADPDFGEAFDCAFPRDLGPRTIKGLRQAIGLVLNFDKGMYEPGKGMISPLATNRLLLGFEGFRRFKIGSYITRIIGEEGQGTLHRLLSNERDPITRALRPLLIDVAFADKQGPNKHVAPLSAFDRALGKRLALLLTHPLAKPTLLRYFALGASLGVVLKVYGAGRPGGRPLLLALIADHSTGSRPLRAEAVQSLQEGRELLMTALATALAEDLGSSLKVRSTKPTDVEAIEVNGGGVRGARALLDALAETSRRSERTSESADEERKNRVIWWPDRFATHLGRKAGCIWPKTDRAGWSSHLALTPEIVEVLTLTEVPPGGKPVPWSKFWKNLSGDLGIVIGASPNSDAIALRDAGLLQISLQHLRENSEKALSAAVRRGAGRRLPDGGAEILGTQE